MDGTKDRKTVRGQRHGNTASTCCKQEEKSNLDPKGTKSGTKILDEQGYRYENQQDYQY